MPTTKKDVFIAEGIFCVLALYVIASSHDLQTALFLFGTGIVLMASTSKERMKQLFDFFLSLFKGLVELVFQLSDR